MLVLPEKHGLFWLIISKICRNLAFVTLRQIPLSECYDAEEIFLHERLLVYILFSIFAAVIQ